MTDIASPDKPLATTDGADDQIRPTTPLKNEPESDVNVKSEDQDQNNTLANGYDNLDATPVANGHTAAEVNGSEHDPDNLRPPKRRRTQDSTPPPSSSIKKAKPVSPPWKKHDAEGPTSYTEGGRRKSGRINTIPLDLQPQGKRRTTRGSISTPKQAQNTPSSKTASAAATPSSQKSRSARRPSSSHDVKKPPHSLKSKSSSRSLRRQSTSPPPLPTRQSTRPRRPSRHAGDDDATTPRHSKRTSLHDPGHSPRIKLRVGRSGDIPLVHPGQVRKRPKIGETFDDFWSRAGDIPVEEGGLYASEDGPRYTDEMARKDAQIIMRIENEVEPGGVLAAGRCTLLAPETSEEPPRQWARQDHMVKAMTNFRKLLLIEQQRHRSTAKRLAEACRDEWIRRQPKSAEQIEREAREACILRYRLVVKTVAGLWDNVRAQVNRNRLEQWEAEEQKRVKAALNEAVNLSEQKLQARRAGLESGSDDDEDLDAMSDVTSNMADGESDSDLDSSDSNSNEDSDVMSTDDETDAEDNADTKHAGDEGLSQEQLRLKYANIPDLEPTESQDMSEAAERPDGIGETTDMGGETSDESVDMDDDMGSSDEDDDSEENDDDDDDDESEDEGEDEGAAGGLLGLFFGKSELQKLHKEATPTEIDVATPQKDIENGLSTTQADDDNDDDRMSFVHHPDANETIPDATTDATAASPAVATEKIAADAEPAVVSEDKVEDETPKEIENASATTEAAETTAQPPDSVNGQTHSNGAYSTEAPSEAHVEVAEPMETVKEETKPVDATETTAVEPKTEADEKIAEEEDVEDVVMRESDAEVVERTHKIEVPFLLRGTLREYQRDGLDWLAGLYANHTNGILADEMGLGKTIQTIALLAHLACQHEVWGPHLVIVPTSVMLNWEMEFKKWCPGFKILAYYGTQEERKRKRQGWNNDNVWNVCITSYQLVLQDQQVFKRRRWHYMILDEAHNIKNFKSQRWQTLLGFNTQARLLLTGTPLQNNLTELWSLLFFLMPAENGVGGFADLQEFHDWFHKPESQILESGRDQMDEEAKAIISKLHKVLRPYLLRRLKADVEKQMPGKYEHVEFCRLSKRQRELYDGFLARSDTKDTLASGNYLSIINCLMQLRKVCNHPDLFVDRPIMTSFKMGSAVALDFEMTERRIRASLLSEKPMSTVDLGFLNLVPTQHEKLSTHGTERSAQLSSHRLLMDMREAQRIRAQRAYTGLDPSTVASNVVYVESASRFGRFEELQHCVYLNALRRQQRPIYGKNLVEMLTIDAHKRPSRPRPKVPRLIMSWFENESNLINSLTPSLEQRANSYKTTIEKFSCVTPAAVTQDLNQVLLGRHSAAKLTDEDLKLSAPVRWAPFMPKEAKHDPWHEARMRLSIQFPDKRLLQYDCGKLQTLDKLLRKLQAGGHRALIFTQMTKVLDILERFLNIHGHKYLRLDGATKVEQRQILTDRFNHDTRILAFILSTRSGGLGINLTGADTVIFYDQDWNPAMDKQCQDRCHRIGQTRDVHIYRLVSEHTIEANILRKASQKQMLDDVVIQEGEFTTDRFDRPSVRDVLGEKLDMMGEGVAAADAALDRVLGGGGSGGNGGVGNADGSVSASNQRNVGRVLEQAEDREDVAAARIAEREIEADDADFTEKPSGASTTRQGTPMTGQAGGLGVDVGRDDLLAEVLGQDAEYNAWGDRISTIDQYMLGMMAEELKYTKLELPKDKKKGKKKGKDTRKR